MVVSGVNHDVASARGFGGAAGELSGAEGSVQTHGSSEVDDLKKYLSCDCNPIEIRVLVIHKNKQY